MRASALLAALSVAGLTRAYTILSDTTLNGLPSPGNDFNIKDGALLAPILRTRVPGTEDILAVQHHLINFFHNSLPHWKVELHNSSSTTPLSKGQQVPFVNIIATRDPPWAQPGEVGRLALVAHYDSKISPKGFIGATDSAAPVAMIMHAARSVDTALTRKWDAMKASGEWEDSLDAEKGVQILFLDGEEAFVSWTDEDSLYGARHLAEDWDQTLHPATSTYKNFLSSISLFLLLDLLGSAGPKVPSYFLTTHWAYKAMADIEQRIRKLGGAKSSPNHPSKRNPEEKKAVEPTFLFEANKPVDRWIGGSVQDDHVPFMARGVEILHMIPSPFPAVWHTPQDDGEHLDIDTVEDWAKIVTAFVGEWMDLEGHFDLPSSKDKQKRSTEAPAQGQGEYDRKSELRTSD